MTLPIALRGLTKYDRSMVFSDWIKSYEKASAVREIPAEVYRYWHHRIVESLIVDPTAMFVIACDQADPTRVFGWACCQRADTLAGDCAVLHYVYVKKIRRRLGVGRALIAAADTRPDVVSLPLVVTALTPAGRELLDSTSRPYVYNPYLAWARTPAPTGDVPAPGVKLPRTNSIAQSRARLAYGGFARLGGGTDDNEEE